MAGDLMLFLGQGYYWIVLGLILNGMGVGFITNSAYMFLAGSSQEEVQKEGFSLFNAGSLAGINCGMMIGASLAENLAVLTLRALRRFVMLYSGSTMNAA